MISTSHHGSFKKSVEIQRDHSAYAPARSYGIAGRGREMLGHVVAARSGRQPDDPGHHLVGQLDRQRDRAVVVADRDLPVDHAARLGGVGAEHSHRRAWRCPAGTARSPSRSCRSRCIRQRRQQRPDRRPGPASAPAPIARGGGAGAGPGAELGELGRACAAVRRPSGSAEPVGQRGQHPEVAHRAAAWRTRRRSRGRGPPSSRRCRPAPRSATTGRTTSARSVTAEARVSMLITKPTRSSPSRAAAGIEQVARIDAGHDQRPELGVAGSREQHLVGVATGLGRQHGRDCPRRPPRRPGRPGRRPGGHRAAGWAGSRPRPPHGRRRGAAPRRAGHRCARPAAGRRSGCRKPARPAPRPG